MLTLTLIVGGMLVVAVLSVSLAHGRFGSDVWSQAYGADGAGLYYESTVIALVALVGLAISVIMSDSFTSLFLDGGWRSPGYLVSVLVVFVGAAAYNVLWAPRALANTYHANEDAWQKCRRPYLVYTPFSIVLWVGFVLPVLALLAISMHADLSRMAAAREDLARNGALVLRLIDQAPRAAQQHVAIYNLDYLEAVDTAQRAVGRYLWVIGVFMLFLIVVINTPITTPYADDAQDIFKWMMWALLGVAVAVCAFGLIRFQGMRDLARVTHEQMESKASARGDLDLVVASRAALFSLHTEGPANFVRGVLASSIWLMAFAQVVQLVLAKIADRSAVDAIFPRTVAKQVHRVLRHGARPPAAAK